MRSSAIRLKKGVRESSHDFAVVMFMWLMCRVTLGLGIRPNDPTQVHDNRENPSGRSHDATRRAMKRVGRRGQRNALRGYLVSIVTRP